jgi:hypothetical protein
MQGIPGEFYLLHCGVPDCLPYSPPSAHSGVVARYRGASGSSSIGAIVVPVIIGTFIIIAFFVPWILRKYGKRAPRWIDPRPSSWKNANVEMTPIQHQTQTQTRPKPPLLTAIDGSSSYPAAERESFAPPNFPPPTAAPFDRHGEGVRMPEPSNDGDSRRYDGPYHGRLVHPPVRQGTAPPAYADGA